MTGLMSRFDIRQSLLEHLEQRTYAARIVAARRVEDLQQILENAHRQGLFDAAFYQERLGLFNFMPPADRLPGACSIIVVAVPRPQSILTFCWNGEQHRVVLPPTDEDYDLVSQQVEDEIAGFLTPQGYGVAPVELPFKLLTVCSGLGQYGRNNICYVPGMGSFHQLVAVYSDLPCPQDDWHEPRRLARCDTCAACQRRCPSGAIPTDRFLLRAERCLTFHNERPANIPFPSWIDPSWHNSLYGCMICQQVCPENQPYLKWSQEAAVFAQQETECLLGGGTLEQLPLETLEKLRSLQLAESLDIVSRNLRVLF